MRYVKKLLALMFTFVFALTLANVNPLVVNAGYTYRVEICLGNNADAYFDADGIATLEADYPGRVDYTDGSDVITIKEFGYNDSIKVNVSSLIKIKPNADGNTKYYLSGLRISGGDTVVTQRGLDATVTLDAKVTGDDCYVVAYGVGATIPYTVKYVDEAGNSLLPDDTLYAARGEVVLVPAKHVDSYYPDALYRTASDGLKDDTVFTFVYKPYTGEVVYVTDTTYSSSTEYGEPTYEYQYTTHRRNENPGGVTNNRPAGGGGGNAADADDNAGAADADQDTTAITDEETPLDIIDIDDEETAKAGGTKQERLVRSMVVGILIAIFAVMIILIALFVANQKRRRVVAKTEEKKDNIE